MHLNEVALLVKGYLVGDPHRNVTGLNQSELATSTELSIFIDNKRTSPEKFKASAALVLKKTHGIDHQIIVPSIKKALITLIPVLEKAKYIAFQKISPTPSDKAYPNTSIHPSAYIGLGTTIGKDVQIGPHVTIGDNCIIGDSCSIYSNVTLYPYTQLKNNVTIHASSVIGSDGFGYENNNGSWQKIPHVGCVILESNVEIGANCVIDRGCLGETRLETGCKIDNQAHISHNVRIGANTLAAAGLLIAGSSQVGANTVIAGDVSISDHVCIGKNVLIYGASKVTKDISDNANISGFPAKDHRLALKEQARLNYLIKQKKKETL